MPRTLVAITVEKLGDEKFQATAVLQHETSVVALKSKIKETPGLALVEAAFELVATAGMIEDLECQPNDLNCDTMQSSAGKPN